MVFIIGTFELNWAEAAQNWYKAKKRHSRIEDASHLLHKGMFIFKVQKSYKWDAYKFSSLGLV